MYPTVIIPSMNEKLCQKALSFVPQGWPYIVKDGNPATHFEDLKTLEIGTKWAINLDEDCFIINPAAILELIEMMEQDGFDMAGIQDGSSHMRYNNPVIFNPFFFVFNVKKLQVVEKKCVDVISESQSFDHLVKFRHLPYKYVYCEVYYPFFIDLLHAGMHPLFLDSMAFEEFPDDGTAIEKPSILKSFDQTEIAIHSWYSRLYHEPVVKQRVDICEEYALTSPHCFQNAGRPIDITVLIPARNAQRTLGETLDSLTKQTLKDFRVLLVDDASSDQTLKIALGFKSKLRIEILVLNENAGVAGALNRGLDQITSKYIARIDADDIAIPTRLEKQFEFLEMNPEISVCSSWMEIFYDDPDAATHVTRKPLDDATIKTALVQYCSMSHGASMFRKSFFDDVGQFDVRLDYSEDYDLWCRGALLGKRYANLPEALTRYRQHLQQVGQENRELQYQRDLMVKRKYMSALLGGESSGNLAEFFHLLSVFVNKDIAITVLQQSLPMLAKLARKVPNESEFWILVETSVGRHLR